MKETAIIYCRKSTKRDDLQQNTLEHQLNNCRNIAKIKNFVVLDEIVESVSAKTELKRAGFNRMISECKKGKIDYIIIDESKRLSRNNIDSSMVIDLLDKKQIKGVIFSGGRQFLAESSTDKLMLLFELGFSKKDNEDRSKDVKDKMISAMNNGKWLSRAIFGYRNVGRKGKKDVSVIEDEAILVRKAFIMRAQNITISEISSFISKQIGKKFDDSRVSRMLTNKRYYGIQEFGNNESVITTDGYKPIISKELYDKANLFKKAVPLKKREDLPRYFTNILKDTDGNNLYPYIKKGNIYYHGGSNTSYKININQNKVFEMFGEFVKNYNFPKPFIIFSKLMLNEYYKDKVNQRDYELRMATHKLNETNSRLESLLNKFLDKEVTIDTYNDKKEKLENEKIELEEEINALKQGDKNIRGLIEELCELVENLSGSYSLGDMPKKGKVIKAMQCELIINNKKELTIKENKLFEVLRLVNSGIWYS